MILSRWFLRVGWAVHRMVFRISGGSVGTKRPRDNRLGTLFLTTTGRTSGQQRATAVYYLEDGASFVVVASNAGAHTDPAWWRNLQQAPHAEVAAPGQRVSVCAREATPEERGRLWPRLVRASPTYAEYQRVASRQIPVVLLEPV
jgi:deazaflavin-dependent oxidoreductase (nitroreductase family)